LRDARTVTLKPPICGHSPVHRTPSSGTSLGRLRYDQGRRQEAYDLLAPVYGWFTKGFDTPDLIDAKALIRELQ
jgi:hypothetical protein